MISATIWLRTRDRERKVKTDVEKLHFELKKIKMDCRLTRIATYKETLLVRKPEQEMGLSPSYSCVCRTLNQMAEQLSICRVAASALLDTTKHHVAN